MGKALHKLGLWMDDFTIKKKFYIFYVVCVLIPLIVTDSVVFLTTAKFDRERREHEMSNIASAVEYSQYDRKCRGDRQQYLYQSRF